MVFFVLWPSSPKVKLNPNHNLPHKKTWHPLCNANCVFRTSFVVSFLFVQVSLPAFGPEFFHQEATWRHESHLDLAFFLPQGLCPSTWFTYNYTMKNICIDTLKFWTVLFFGGQGKCIDIYKCVAMTVMIVFFCFVSLFLWFLLFFFGRPSRHPNANCQWLVLGNLHRLSRFSIGFEPFNWIGSVGCSSSGYQEKKRLTRILGYSTSFKDGKVTITKESSASAKWIGILWCPDAQCMEYLPKFGPNIW